MKKIIVLLLLSASIHFAQEFKFAWLTDTHIGYTNADTELDSVVKIINDDPSFKFTIVTGDITEKGRNDELTTAFEILEKLKNPYYIIPGNHDTKWSESGLTKFTELWKDDKFEFDYNGYKFVGLNSGIPWRGGGGHIAPQDLMWLENTLLQSENFRKTFFFVHHPLDESIDNWYKVTNILRKYNVGAIFCGHTHTSKVLDFNGIPAAMSRAVISKGKTSEGFSSVTCSNDTLYFSEIDTTLAPKDWGSISLTDTLNIPVVDSASTIVYDAEIIWEYDTRYTVSPPPMVYKDHIYTADYSGLIYCLDTLGNLVWDYDAFGNIMSRPAAADDILIAATVQGDLLTINAQTGEAMQTIGFDTPVTSQLVTYEYMGNRSFMLPKPRNLKSTVIFGTASGKLYCYDLETLEMIWENDAATAMIETKPLVYDDKIYYGAWDGNFYCVDAKSGLLIWKWRDGGNFYYSPAAVVPVTDGENIYLTTPEKKVYAIDMLLGTTQWKSSEYKAWESIGIANKGNRLFVKSMEDKFHIISAKTGNPVKNYNFDFGIDTMPVELVETGDEVYFGTKNGDIYAVNNNKFTSRKILFMGSARIHSIIPYDEHTFVASNMDGKLIMFRTK